MKITDALIHNLEAALGNRPEISSIVESYRLDETKGIQLDECELATVLVALRLFRKTYEDVHGDAIREEWSDHFEGVDDAGDPIMPLGSEDIDTLCERINTK